MSTEAMKLALEALTATMATHGFREHIEETKDKAIEALEDALAKQEQGEPVRGLVKELMRQIEIGDFVDGHGHSAKMLDAVHKLNKELQND